MKKSVALFAVVSLLSGAVALAAPPTKDTKTKKTTKVTEVWTCPITGDTIKDHAKASPKTAMVGNYKVHFCCAGCPESFAKLSKTDQKTKAVEAAKKDAEAAKTKKS